MEHLVCDPGAYNPVVGCRKKNMQETKGHLLRTEGHWELNCSIRTLKVVVQENAWPMRAL